MPLTTSTTLATSVTRRLPRRPALVAAAALSSLALAGLGGATHASATDVTGTTATFATGTFGTVDPSTYLPVTGALGYSDPAIPPLRVVPVSTTAALKTALDTAKPGDAITLAAGTYQGRFLVDGSGTRLHPIVVRPAAGAKVTLTASLTYPGCDATGPDGQRTVSFVQGASNWVLRDLTITGGVTIISKNADNVQQWQSDLIGSGDWQSRRSVPGSASRDAVAARDQTAFFTTTTGVTVRPSQGIQLLGNTITGKGVFGRMALESVISGNTVTDIACGTGPAIWLAAYSRANVISGNAVARVDVSTASHYMQEGIRLGNGSDYNVVVGNRVTSLPDNGRAITTDQDSSWNLLTQNQVSDVDIAYNEQQSAWGNVWSYNDATRARVAAYSFRMEDTSLAAPSRDTSSFLTQVRCNTASSDALDLQAGAVSGGDFSGNLISSWSIGKQLAGYWTSVGNLWNGSTSAPSVSSPVTTAGC